LHAFACLPLYQSIHATDGELQIRDIAIERKMNEIERQLDVKERSDTNNEELIFGCTWYCMEREIN
jgi:hypothetical protein